MKGPSADAIKKFKQQQEAKKLEEEERRKQERINILNCRAAQGDRKAKHDIRLMEKLEEERKQTSEKQSRQPEVYSSKSSGKSHSSSLSNRGKIPPAPKPKKDDFDFNELMQLAKKNTNVIKKPEEPKASREERPVSVPQSYHSIPQASSRSLAHPSPTPPTSVKHSRTISDKSHQRTTRDASTSCPDQQELQATALSHQQNRLPIAPFCSLASHCQNCSRQVSNFKHQAARVAAMANSRKAVSHQPVSSHRPSYPPSQQEFRRRSHHYNDYDEDDDEEEYEDDYEEDDFVVNDEGDDAKDELRKTLRSVFNYDKNRCDRREEALDRLDRAIGKVSNFEDLEREERRASRLAAAEDARAFREDEERKRQKQLRLKKLKT